MIALCGKQYVRPGGVTLACTFPVGHQPDTFCSWEEVRQADAAEAAVDYSPTAVQALLDAITRGEMDPYLEAVLAVAHNRKRALRGVPGFGHILPRKDTPQ